MTTLERGLSDVLMALEYYTVVKRSKALTSHSVEGLLVVFHVCSVTGSMCVGTLKRQEVDSQEAWKAWEVVCHSTM